MSDPGPKAFTVEIRNDGTKHIYSAAHDLPVDPNVSLILGDAVHNLRAALDHLAWQLVLAHKGAPVAGQGGTQFPTLWKPGSFQITGGVDPKAHDIIDDVQPYRGTDAAKKVAAIAELDIVDKHHQLLVAAASGGSTGEVLTDDRPRVASRHRPPVVGALEAGDEVATITYTGPMAHRDPDLKVLLDIAFVVGPIANESFMEIGELCRWMSDDFLPRFAGFF